MARWRGPGPLEKETLRISQNADNGTWSWMVSEDSWLCGYGVGPETRDDCEGSSQRHIALRTKVRAELVYNQNPSPANA